MKISITSPLICMIVLVTACTREYWVDPCENCFQEKPEEGIITVNTSYEEGDAGIPIKVYEGKNIESNKIVLLDTLFTNKADVWVRVGYSYTVEAEYKIQNKTFLAVDRDKVSVYLDDESCDQACWRPRDGKVNCKLN